MSAEYDEPDELRRIQQELLAALEGGQAAVGPGPVADALRDFTAAVRRSDFVRGVDADDGIPTTSEAPAPRLPGMRRPPVP